MRRWPTEDQLKRYYSRLEHYAKPLKAEEFFPEWDEMIERLRLSFGDNDEYKEFFATASEQHQAMCAVGVPLYRIWNTIREAELYNEPWPRVNLFYKNCPLLSPEEIFECLVGLCEENLSMILHHFESVSYDRRLSIIDALYHEKKRRFCRLINGYFSPDDFMVLSDICWNNKLAETSGFGYQDGSSYVLTEKKKGKKRPIVESSYSSVDAVRAFHGAISLGYRHLWEYLYKFPFYEEPYRQELLTEREKRIITEVMSRPEAAFYERENRAFEEFCRQEFNKSSIQEQSSEEKLIPDEKPVMVNAELEQFLLPDNLFSPESKVPIDQKNPKAHFIPDFDIQKQGGSKFAELVNTISSFGYIAPSTRSKRLLTYVLTGRYQPEDYQIGEKVEWLDSSNGYELLYVIKYIIGNEKGKYSKVLSLFNGPQWSGNGEFKDQADYASTPFRKALNSIYPKECKLKGISAITKGTQQEPSEWSFIPPARKPE